jgi:YozE SAM-like fold
MGEDLTFLRWLQKQQNRNDRIGDLAKDILADPHCPTQLRKIGPYLNSLYVEQCVLDSFAQAEGEYHGERFYDYLDKMYEQRDRKRRK